MKCTRLVLYCLSVLFFFPAAKGQDFSNKGKDFWLGYGFHVNMGSGVGAGAQNQQDMILYFTSDKNAVVSVEIPGVGYTKSYTVTANQVTISDPIPKTGAQDARISGTGYYNRGIHITSDVPIVAYAHIYNASVSGASLLFPTNTLGKDYYSINYTQSSNTTFSNSFFFVVATEDNTKVEITASAANLNGFTPNVAQTVTLNKGQVYSVMGTTAGTSGTDLTGSRIRSISTNGSGGCKAIAVFSGSGKVSIGGSSTGSADNLFAQAFPAAAWGKKYLTAPTGSQPNNYYRICVTDPATVVKLNGVVIPTSSLINNFFYQFKNGAVGNSPGAAVPNLIEADKPITVAQYCTTQGVDGNPGTSPGGDPEMIYLSPVEQTINDITLYSATKNAILQSYINVIIRNGGVASFRMDGNPVSNFLPHPQDANYSYAIISVSSGSHRLYSDTGFNAIAYGFGSTESYGYNAGTNIRDFSARTVFQNPYSRVDSAVTCINTPFKLSVPMTVQPSSIKWDFSAAPNISPSAQQTLQPVPDSAVNGVYYYSPQGSFSFSKANTPALRDTIKLYTTSATPDGCGSKDQLFNIPVKVNELPVPQFAVANSGCVSDSVQFTDQSSYSSTLVRWQWNFGDGTTDERASAAVFAKKYTNGGTYTAKLKVYTDIGCVSPEVSQVLDISSKPVARFTVPSLLCPQSDISFTDASTTTVGTLATWVWSLDDGAAPISNTTNAAVKTKYDSAGTKNLWLLVASSTGCKSDTFRQAVKINPLPVVGFRVPEVCLNDANARFTDTSTIAEGSIVSYAWNFNAGSPVITPGPQPAVSSLQHPQPKYFKSDYYKVKLTATSDKGCVASSLQDFTVNGSTPKADFSFSGITPYCGDKPVKLINQSTVDFGNVTKLEFYWDNTNSATVKETDEYPAGGKLYAHSYTAATGARQYSVRMLAYSGGNSCVSETTKTVTVYPQPDAAYSVSVSQLCDGGTVSFTDKSQAGTATVASWRWDLGRNTIALQQNPVRRYNDSGSIATSLVVTTSDGCISDTARSVLTIYPNPKLGMPASIQMLEDAIATLKPVSVYGSNLEYLWTPTTYIVGSNTLSEVKVSPPDDATFTLQLTAEGGCTVTGTTFVKVLHGLEIPNGFSPNGDGINDTWHIKYLDGYPEVTIDVYDRAGQIVFRSVGSVKDWDGTYQGKPLPIGTYYYIINPKAGKKGIYTGSITIIK
ncbi:PKD domain-containing protein [Sediminibacterium soli]|uniref:PKD domain-containing protein n=1 Tax=Sediminibacterium soli TaxID=2698829 RepID=UPI00137B165C|nr:PKD domain-containing protein [Sediminibacterium soli]NCI46339.1 T9SS type B sorting domain-containing protein [Sediminibacterium soli]